MQGWLQDLRYGARLLAKRPGFTAVVVMTLALGIGANTAIFSVVNGVLLAELPYPQSSRLVYLWQTHPEIPVMSISYPDFVDWRERSRSFEELGVYRRVRMNLTGIDEPRELQGAMASAGLLRACGVKPALGRLFGDEEDRPGGDDVVVLSHSLWKAAFGADNAILGSALLLDGKARTVIGVMPEGFSFPSRIDFYVPVGPMAATPGWADRGNHPGLFGLARLEDGVTLEQARAEMDAVSAALAEEYPDHNTGTGAVLTPLREVAVRNVRPALLMMEVAVGLVLLIACANVMNLTLGRAAVRQREVAIRAALGAGRGRLVRMFLTESTLLALLGGTLGLALAKWGIDAVQALAVGSLPSSTAIVMDGRVLAFTLVLSVMTGILFGLLPALHASSRGADSLKEGGRMGTGSRRTRRTRGLLVVSEVALALVLLVGAGLMTKSFLRLADVDPGFDPDELLTVRISLPELKYPDAESYRGFFGRLFERVGSLPGVGAVALTSNLPFVDGSQTGFWVSGRPAPAHGEGPIADYSAVSTDYFRAMGVPVLRGRGFDTRDTTDAPRVVLVDELMVRQYFPDEDPLGKRLTDGGDDVPENRLTIIGVVPSMRLSGMNVEAPRPQIYFPYTQSLPLQTTLLVRGSGATERLTSAIRSAVLDIDPDQPISRVQTMASVVEGSLAPWRLNMLLVGLLSATATLLAVVGLYGVVSYMVTQRTGEIGIRMAVGAQRGDVVRLVLKQGMGMTLLGIAAGVAVALALTWLIGSLLYGVSPTDPLSFASVVVLLGLTALAACWVPARRAARVDPMVALRCE